MKSPYWRREWMQWEYRMLTMELLSSEDATGPWLDLWSEFGDQDEYAPRAPLRWVDIPREEWVDPGTVEDITCRRYLIDRFKNWKGRPPEERCVAADLWGGGYLPCRNRPAPGETWCSKHGGPKRVPALKLSREQARQERKIVRQKAYWAGYAQTFGLEDKT